MCQPGRPRPHGLSQPGRAGGAGFPVVRKGSVASRPQRDDTNLLVAFSTFGGDSGAPVIRLDKEGDGKRKPVVAGIVAGWPTRFATERAHTLGFRAEPDYDAIIRAHIEDELS